MQRKALCYCWGRLLSGEGAGSLQCQEVLLIWIMIVQGPTVFAVGAGGGLLDIILSSSFLSLFNFSLSLGDAGYRLRYCLKELNQIQPTNRTTNQATNHQSSNHQCCCFHSHILHSYVPQVAQLNISIVAHIRH